MSHIIMEGSLHKITGGSHMGMTGTKVGETPHFIRLQIGDRVVRCRKEFVVACENITDIQQEQQDAVAPQLSQTESCKAYSEMITQQNKEYQEALQKDLQKFNSQKTNKTPQFEEVSIEEMRRVRLLRFQNG